MAQSQSDFWDTLQGKLPRVSDDAADVWSTLAAKLDPAVYRPCCVPDAQVTRSNIENDTLCYVVHNPQSLAYVELDEHNYFLWQLLDGRHTVADLAMAYFNQFGTLPFERLDQLLLELKANDLLTEKPLDIYGTLNLRLIEHTFAYRLQHFSDTAFQKEVDLNSADQLFTALYRHGAWLLFTRPALILLALVAIAGLACFFYLEPSQDFQLFGTSSLHGVGLLLLIVANLFVILCHESAHALTCKSYGSRVRKAGFMFYFGTPAFFVDTTDIWLKGRTARIAVSLAGPCMNLIVGSVIAVLVALLSDSGITRALFQLAYVAYLGALLNLNPLLELDGYYVLMDWVRVPQLRSKSFAFVKSDLWGKLRQHQHFDRDERIFTLYGVLALLYTVATVVLVVYVWQNEADVLLKTIFSGEDILAAVLLSALALMAGTTLVLALAVRIVLFANAEGKHVSALLAELRHTAPKPPHGTDWGRTQPIVVSQQTR